MGEKPVVGYTVKQTAESLNVNPVTVRRWIRAGLPAFNVGSIARPDYRIEPDVLRAWLTANKPGREGIK
jgi:Helix-turn-helix domain